MVDPLTAPAPGAERSRLSGLLRGAFGGSGAWRAEIAASPLPPQTRSLIERVTARAGGRASERLETARELVSHFSDALAAGRTEAEAIASFGDERRAASLLRKAIRRKRGLLAKGVFWSTRMAIAGTIVLGVGYAWLATRFYLAEPRVAVDYLALARALAPAPEGSERAWPIYRSALAILKAEERWIFDTLPGAERKDGPLAALDPTSEAWRRTERALEVRARELASLREASRLESLGITLGTLEPGDEEVFDTSVMHIVPAIDGRAALFEQLLPHCAELRRASRWLAADAVHAAARGDGDRTAQDVAAMLGLARQTRRPFLVEQLVSFAIASSAFEAVQEVLDRWPGALTDAQLARIDSDLARYTDDLLTVRFDAEMYGLEDMLQRAFTDDGTGDGHMTAAAMRGVWRSNEVDEMLELVLAPTELLAAASRRETRERFEQDFAFAERIQQLRPWQWPDDGGRRGASSSARGGRGFAMLNLADASGAPRSVVAAHTARVRRDICRTVVALHRFRAAEGAWPTTLESLIGRWLDAVPLDPFDGKPLRYELREGQPTLWSVGVDRRDDRLAVPREFGRLGTLLGDDPGAVPTSAEGGSHAGERAPDPDDGTDIQLWPPYRSYEAPGEPALLGA